VEQTARNGGTRNNGSPPQCRECCAAHDGSGPQLTLPLYNKKMLKDYIENFIGEWQDETGNRLQIRKLSATACTVTFLGAFNGAPISRPWFGGRPSVDMPAQYDPHDEPDLRVELWESRRGFTLHLDCQPCYDLDEDRRESLVPWLSRYDRDGFLDQYYGLLGPLSHFTRRRQK
jgi:hypothetical protein